jgi:hypothetical protein
MSRLSPLLDPAPSSRSPADRLPDVVYHLTHASNAPLIARDGLHPTTALLRAAGIDASSTNAFRHQTTTLPTGIVLRDQRPMPPKALFRCLDPPLTPNDWYELVNMRVFFWLDRDRLLRHWAASPRSQQICYTVSTRRLLERYAKFVELSPFNSGSALRRAAKRGHRTFVPLLDWMRQGWRTEALPGTTPRSPSHRPAELTVRLSIPDFSSLVISQSSAVSGDFPV